MKKLIAVLALFALTACEGYETTITCDASRKDEIQEFIRDALIADQGTKSVNRSYWKAAALFNCTDKTVATTDHPGESKLFFKYGSPEAQ